MDFMLSTKWKEQQMSHFKLSQEHYFGEQDGGDRELSLKTYKPVSSIET